MFKNMLQYEVEATTPEFFESLFDSKTLKDAIAIGNRYIDGSFNGYEPKDAVQNVCCKMIEKGAQAFEKKGISQARRYFLKSVKHECLNIRARIRASEIKHYQEETLVASFFPLFSQESLGLLAQLKEIQRKVFEMKLNGYKLKEIAEELNMKLDNVKYHYGEAKKKLKILLEKE